MCHLIDFACHVVHVIIKAHPTHNAITPAKPDLADSSLLHTATPQVASFESLLHAKSHKCDPLCNGSTSCSHKA
jgi:hypothetical protein